MEASEFRKKIEDVLGESLRSKLKIVFNDSRTFCVEDGVVYAREWPSLCDNGKVCNGNMKEICYGIKWCRKWQTWEHSDLNPFVTGGIHIIRII